MKIKESSMQQLKDICLMNPYSLHTPENSNMLETTKRIQPESCMLGDISEIMEIRESMWEIYKSNQISEIEQKIRTICLRLQIEHENRNIDDLFKILSEMSDLGDSSKEIDDLEEKYLHLQLVGKQSRLQDRVFRGFSEVHLSRKIVVRPLMLPEIHKISNFSEAYVLKTIRKEYLDKLEFFSIERRRFLNSRFQELYEIWRYKKQEQQIANTIERESKSAQMSESEEDNLPKRERI